MSGESVQDFLSGQLVEELPPFLECDDEADMEQQISPMTAYSSHVEKHSGSLDRAARKAVVFSRFLIDETSIF